MGRMRQVLDPDGGSHVAVYARTGTGKTHLIVRMVLPMCHLSRVVIIDVKGDDRVWRGIGAEVDRLPADLSQGGGGPAGMWWRLVADATRDPDQAGRVMRAALTQIAAEGHCVVILDEGLALAGVKDLVNQLLSRGRARGISVVIASPEAVNAPTSMHRQWTVMFVGLNQDDDTQDRIVKIGSLGRVPGIRTLLGEIPPRTFLYVDRAAGAPMLGLVEAPS
jgi:hypothetical protein